LKLQFGQNRGWNWASARRSNFFFLACKIEIFVDALHDGGLEACDLVKFVEKILQLAVEGVRNTRSYPKTGVLALLMLSYMNADA
jgi:hypothetical protein